jgi:hypothetical protein
MSALRPIADVGRVSSWRFMSTRPRHPQILPGAAPAPTAPRGNGKTKSIFLRSRIVTALALAHPLGHLVMLTPHLDPADVFGLRHKSSATVARVKRNRRLGLRLHLFHHAQSNITTLAACGLPSFAVIISNSTRASNSGSLPRSKLLIELTWTKTSSCESSGVMKPKPRSPTHLRIEPCIFLPVFSSYDSRSCRSDAARAIYAVAPIRARAGTPRKLFGCRFINSPQVAQGFALYPRSYILHSESLGRAVED